MNKPLVSTDTQPPSARWGAGQKKFLLLVVAALAAHLTLIFLFGTRLKNIPTSVTNAPHWQMTRADRLLELNSPALFALPNNRDFISEVWQKKPQAPLPSFRYREAPRWLALPREPLGNELARFMATNRFAPFEPDLKPATIFSATPKYTAASRGYTFCRISGGLTRRNVQLAPALPTLSLNEIPAPSRVQALVDATGTVVSAVLLPPPLTEATSRNSIADARALALTLQHRFTPGKELTLGEFTYHWQTIPETATNAP